ncbi:MAG: OmpA family protein [Rhizobiales bacterium]|nr:OmpA family protein [Hyphomicrobiales bacterium]
MLRFLTLILAGMWVVTVAVLAQEQAGETTEQLMEQAPELSPDAATVPQDVLEFLRDRRPASELSDTELGQRSRQAQQLARLQGLTTQVRDELRAVAQALRAERQARLAMQQDHQAPQQDAGGSEPQSGYSEQSAGQAETALPEEPKPAGPPAAVAAFLADNRPPGDLTNAELGQKSRQARNFMAIQSLDTITRQQLRDIARALQSEQAARQKASAQDDEPTASDKRAEVAPANPDAAAEEPQTEIPAAGKAEADGPAPPEVEQQARAMLADQKPAEELTNEQLSERLKEMRSVLQEPRLSKKEQRALRKKLQAEREILRARVARTEPQADAPENGSDTAPANPPRQREQSRMDTNWPVSEVLRDQRPADGLETGQLRRRIAVYRDAMENRQYAPDERDRWRSGYERDRRELRRRMFEQRREREAYWNEQRRQGNLDININIGVNRGDDEPYEIWADEVDDYEIEEQLLAGPRRKVQRRYSIADFEDDPELRDVMPGVEIDTIRFGFNEAFVREEEIDNLDRIAETIEKILAARPGEVFLIEGHTDAVGSDAYNLRLSRQRAQAVKDALTTYYVIPARNLETIGYGERYLKIPTDEPEQENRRVALRRVTPLVGARNY